MKRSPAAAVLAAAKLGAPAARGLAAGALVTAALAAGVLAGGALGASSPGATGSRGLAATPCGPAAAEVLARTAGATAVGIYSAEVNSSEVSSDRHQVESYGPLLSAVSSGNRAAVSAAVTTLVFSHTHIVRLRVSRCAELLADVGGPYILAPITGTLRSGGRAIGHYAFSVQDDLGYIKLVTRFTGAPVILRTASGQVPVEGQLSPGPPSIPAHGPVEYRHTAYEAYSFNATAYPSGRLRVSLLLPVPRSLAAESCAKIKAQETGTIAQHISRRFQLSPASYPPYIRLVHTLTSALVYVRAGGRTLAGSTRTTPARLPAAGAVRFHGVDFEVASFLAPTSSGQAHVYVLVRR